MNKFKVGDIVRYQNCDNTPCYYGTVVEIKSDYYLCKLDGFDGHNVNGRYNSNDYWYCREDRLYLLYRDKMENKGENVKMACVDKKYVKDIRVDDKVIIVPKKNAAPERVNCKTVVVNVNGKDYEAVCMPGDEFSLERGIEVAILKSMCGGTQEYNKYLRSLVKFYNGCEKKRKTEKEEAERLAKKKAKEAARNKARRERKANAERQARVNEMSEAFLKAMRDYDGIGMDSMIDEETTRCIDLNVENARIEEMCNAFLRSKGLVAVPANNDLK